MIPRTLFSFRLAPKPSTVSHQLLRTVFPSPPCLRSPFSTAFRHYASKHKTRTSPKPSLKPSRYTPKPPSLTPYAPFAATLASRPEPTLLYLSSSYKTYILGCYAIGLLCFAWSAHATYQITYHPPSYFNRLLKTMYYGICGLAVGLSALFILRPYRIIQSIHAVSIPGQNGTRTLHLQLESARLLPGIRPRTVSVPADSVIVSEPLNPKTSGGVPLHIVEFRARRAEKAKKLHEGNFITLPFRQLGFHLWNFWQALKGVFTNNLFVHLRVKGFYGTWKLGREAGWALDEGRALDRIVRSRVMA